MMNLASVLALYNLIFLVSFLKSESVEGVLDVYESDYSLDFKKSELESLVYESRNETDIQFPYLVFLYFEGRYRCSATLISDRLVMTAIHCVNEVQSNPSTFIGHAAGSVKGGFSNLRIEFEAIHTLSNRKENGIALLVTKEKVTFSADVGRICLSNDPTKEWKYQDLMAIFVDGINSTSQVPKSAQVKVVNKSRCGTELESKICVYGESTMLCNDDTGGPLIAEKDGVLFQIGVLLGASVWEKQIPQEKECSKLVIYDRVSHYYKFFVEAAKFSNSDICILD